MPKITFLPHKEIWTEGATIDVPKGTSICRAALDSGIMIEHACELSCACTTCHVYVNEGYDSLDLPTEDEDDYLDKAWGLKPQSRLSCQAIINNKDLIVEIPKYTINQVSESN